MWSANLAAAIRRIGDSYGIVFHFEPRLAQRKGDVSLTPWFATRRSPLLLPLILAVADTLMATLPAAHFPENVDPNRACIRPRIDRRYRPGYSDQSSSLTSSPHRYRIDLADTHPARRVQTQIQVLHRIVVVIIVVVALSVMLMTFPTIKHIGMSLLASAGLAGLIVGMAMKSTLSSLIAGIQIARLRNQSA